MDFQLTSGERVIWRGAPTHGIRFHAQDFFLIPFALFWLFMVLAGFGLVAFGETEAQSDPGTYLILPFFLVIGLYILVGRFVIDSWSRSRTEYALTNFRAIIEGGILRRTTRSVNLAAVPEIRFREGRNGRGTIEFASGTPFGGLPRNWPGMSQYMSPAFDGVDGARGVYEMALTAQREAQAKG